MCNWAADKVLRDPTLPSRRAMHFSFLHIAGTSCLALSWSVYLSDGRTHKIPILSHHPFACPHVPRQCPIRLVDVVDAPSNLPLTLDLAMQQTAQSWTPPLAAQQQGRVQASGKGT